MKAKTNFIEVLERIHSKSDLRYGQILYTAMIMYASKTGRYFDIFYIPDELFTQMLDEFEQYWDEHSLMEKGIE